jgi:hypothetical protein
VGRERCIGDEGGGGGYCEEGAGEHGDPRGGLGEALDGHAVTDGEANPKAGEVCGAGGGVVKVEELRLELGEEKREADDYLGEGVEDEHDDALGGSGGRVRGGEGTKSTQHEFLRRVPRPLMMDKRNWRPPMTIRV